MINEELLKKDKKILKLHLIYWAIIFAILFVCLICIIPGYVNDRAFDNFSFASIIVSIVLAVVSIVYSFRSKSFTSDNIAGIREIENSINDKLQKFDTLQNNISTDVQSAISEGVGKAISEIRDDVGNLKEDQADIKQSMSQIVQDQKKYFEPETKIDSSKTEKRTVISGPSFIGKVAMYIASRCHDTKKELVISSIDSLISSDKDYYWGYYSALASCLPDYFRYGVSFNPITFSFPDYNEDKLGTSDYWKSEVMNTEEKTLSEDYINKIELYLENSGDTVPKE